MLNLFELVEQAREHPQDYFGAITELQDQGWAATFGRHRDSDLLDVSNFETILKRLEEAGFEQNEDFRVEGSSHWAVGWCDTLMVRALQCKCEDWEDAEIIGYSADETWRCRTCEAEFDDREVRPIFKEVIEIKEALDEYPVLDEEDWSRREYEEFSEWIEDEVSSIVSRYDGELIKEDAEIEASDVMQLLYDEHSVSNVEDCQYAWIEDAVLTVAERKGLKI